MKIKKATKKDLPLLKKYLGHEKMPNLHEKKINEQEKGDSLWLIAWIKKRPIGHVQIRFSGAREKEIQKKLKNCPHLETLGVHADLRRKGLAKKIIQYVEDLVLSKGYNKIGLSVESNDKFLNNLYLKLGYKNWKGGKLKEVWGEEITGKKGKTIIQLNYLIKNLK